MRLLLLQTNRLVDNYMELIKLVIDTFKPGKLMVTFYATRTSPAITFHEELKNSSKVNQFRRNDVQFCSFQAGYSFILFYYFKNICEGL